ncbi:MAG: hypothetical protein L0287_27470 [Anaerolineae bacterium]|nr:hypothetical protein [Anaerolineae bacterium]
MIDPSGHKPACMEDDCPPKQDVRDVDDCWFTTPYGDHVRNHACSNFVSEPPTKLRIRTVKLPLYVGGIEIFFDAMAGEGGDDEEGEVFPGLGTGTPGMPPKGKRGIYEFFDQIKKKWYVGSAYDEDLAVRLRGRVKDGTIKTDSLYWTEIDVRIEGGQSTKAIRVAEQIRIEQVSKLVGGRQNMANDPYTNAASPQAVTNWFKDKWHELPGWPSWLKNPFE